MPFMVLKKIGSMEMYLIPLGNFAYYMLVVIIISVNKKMLQLYDTLHHLQLCFLLRASVQIFMSK